MALVLSSLYEALIAAGASPDKARAAAEEIARRRPRSSSVSTQLRVLEVLMVLNMAGVFSLVLKAWFWK